MKTMSVCGILVASLIIALSVNGAFAQQMGWGPQGMYPGGMGMNMGMGMAPPPPAKCKPEAPAPCMPAMNPGCSPFPGCNPYPCPPPMCKPRFSAEPSLYVGYLYKDHGGGIEVQFDNGDIVGITHTRNDFTLQGVWAEFAVPVCLAENLTGFFTAAHLFPVETTTTETYRLLNGGFASREWQPSVQWWEFDWGLTYRLCPYAAALGGFRWSSFIVNFDQPSNQNGFLPAAPDDARLTLNAYLPFFGLLANLEPSCTSSIKAAVFGFPAVPADVEYQESYRPTAGVFANINGKGNYKSGYFLEALAEASTTMDRVTLGGFVRFDLLHTERTRDITVTGVPIQANIGIDRRNWIFGGKLGYLF
jgi:hypothetical protein